MDIYFLTPIMGAIIGYLTNWLAIKMLFRPHEELKILGIKVPLTPGVIPKERYKLSKKFGKTVEDYILTEEVIKNSLLSKISVDAMLDSFQIHIDNFKNNNYSIEEVLNCILGENLNKQQIRNKLFLYLKNYGTSKIFLDVLCNNVLNLTHMILNRKIKDINIEIISSLINDLSKEEFKVFIKDKILENFDNLKQSSDKMSKYIDDGVLIAIVNERVPYILDKIIIDLESNENLNNKLKNILNLIIDNNINKFTSIFINKDKIYDNIKDELIKYLSDDSNILLIIDNLNKYISNKLDKEIGEVLKSIDENTFNSIKYSFNLLLSKFSKQNYDKILKTILSNLFDDISDITINNLFKKFNSSFNNELKSNIKNYITKLVDKHIDFVADKVSELLLQHFFNFKINFLIDNIYKYNSIIFTQLDRLIFNSIIYITKNISIGTILENEINKLDVHQGEKIIVDIVKKELQMITALGGVLGFIISLIPLIINRFMG